MNKKTLKAIKKAADQVNKIMALSQKQKEINVLRQIELNTRKYQSGGIVSGNDSLRIGHYSGEIIIPQKTKAQKISEQKLWDKLINKTKKDMKTKVKHSVIKKYYKKACEDVKAELRQDFPEVFKSDLPKTWGEYCEIKGYHTANRSFKDYREWIKGSDMGKDYNLFWDDPCEIPSKYIASRKLEKLRNHYNDGWKPNYTDKDQRKHVMCKNKNSYESYHTYNIHHFLSFKTEQLRKEFLTNFRELIIEAEDLI